jgi:hypothetical protein
MGFPGVGSPRIAQLALAALICTGLAACGASSNPAGAAASAVAANASASSLGTSSGSLTSSSDPSNKSITLSWSQPTQNSDGTSLTDLAGYTLHYGTASQDYTGTIQITSPTQTSYVVSDGSFPPGTYYFAISAFNAQQVSSSLSSEVAVNVD